MVLRATTVEDHQAFTVDMEVHPANTARVEDPLANTVVDLLDHLGLPDLITIMALLAHICEDHQVRVVKGTPIPINMLAILGDITVLTLCTMLPMATAKHK